MTYSIPMEPLTVQTPLLPQAVNPVSPLIKGVITVAVVAISAFAIPLIKDGAAMVQSSLVDGPEGWTAWEESNPPCAYHLGAAAFNRVGGTDALVNGIGCVAPLAGFLFGKLANGRVERIGGLATAALGIASGITGNLGALYAIQDGVKSPSSRSQESFVDGWRDEKGCNAKHTKSAETLFLSTISKSISTVCLMFVAGLGVHRLLNPAR